LQGNPIAEFQTGHGWATSVSFSPDGNAIATVGQDSTAKLWAIEPLEDLLIKGCQQTADYLRTNASVGNQGLCQGVF
jgi:WD40 repeat protein